MVELKITFTQSKDFVDRQFIKTHSAYFISIFVTTKIATQTVHLQRDRPDITGKLECLAAMTKIIFFKWSYFHFKKVVKF